MMSNTCLPKYTNTLAYNHINAHTYSLEFTYIASPPPKPPFHLVM